MANVGKKGQQVVLLHGSGEGHAGLIRQLSFVDEEASPLQIQAQGQPQGAAASGVAKRELAHDEGDDGQDGNDRNQDKDLEPPSTHLGLLRGFPSAESAMGYRRPSSGPAPARHRRL